MGFGASVDGMTTPSVARVRVDGQGRMVLPRAIRDDLLHVPGEVLVRRTDGGWLISAAESSGTATTGDDGLPVLSIGRPVTTAEVLDAIEQERAEH
jgi:bifunctional DNA-binding transcriptional regulator/antitoxin component of YhaV-PrlF toxin-antitoxin module